MDLMQIGSTEQSSFSSRFSWLGILKNHAARLVFTWLAVLGMMLLFGEIADEILEREPLPFDDAVLLWLNQNSGSTLDAIMLAFSWAGGTLGVVPSLLVISALLAKAGRRRDALFVLCGLLGTGIFNLIAKATFQRSRPELWISIAPEKDYGFPSGHSMLSACFAGVLIALLWQSQSLSKPRKWLLSGLLILFAVGVGLSRMYLGVHYPTDVAAAWAATVAWVMLLTIILRPHRHRVRRKRAIDLE